MELKINTKLDQSHPAAVELRRRIAKYEDQGFGACWLQNDEAAALVENALLYHDQKQSNAIAWCVMPNHVHILLEKDHGFELGKVLHSWKSWTALNINRMLGRSGELWAREGFDRDIRNDIHLANVIRYIEQNPVSAGLTSAAETWRYSSASRRGRPEGDEEDCNSKFTGAAGAELP